MLLPSAFRLPAEADLCCLLSELQRLSDLQPVMNQTASAYVSEDCPGSDGSEGSEGSVGSDGSLGSEGSDGSPGSSFSATVTVNVTVSPP